MYMEAFPRVTPNLCWELGGRERSKGLAFCGFGLTGAPSFSTQVAQIPPSLPWLSIGGEDSPPHNAVRFQRGLAHPKLCEYLKCPALLP